MDQLDEVMVSDIDESTIKMEQQADDCSDQEADIINHLLFHKAIIREPGERTIDLDSYMTILRELDSGMHVVLDNPVDRAVAIAFQLVIDERFDPWNLDLVEFTKLYLKKIRKEEDINFIIAGKIIMMAWSILKTQSEHVLVEADKHPEPEEFYFGGWDPCELYESEQSTSYTDLVLENDGAPITEAVRGNDVRAVTLMSLIEAFDEARAEMALRERIKKFAVRETYEPVNIGEKVHNENLQEDISITWQRICNCDEALVPMSRLWNGGDVWDRVTVFVSTLFLANMNKVKLTQRRFPNGEIMIRNIEDFMPMEAIPAETETMMDQEMSVSLEDLAVV